MTTISEQDADLGASLAMLWRRHRQTNLDRISLLEAVAADVLRGVVDDTAVVAGSSAAHKLAGSLGTFGFDDGSRAALEAESLLRDPAIDGRLLAEAVMALRSSVADEAEDATTLSDGATYGMLPGSGSGAHVISLDTDLVSRLTVEAAATGLAVTASAELPRIGSLSRDGQEMFVVDAAIRTWTRSGMLNSVAELARNGLVIVLSDNDLFEERVKLVLAGAAGVVPRSQVPRQLISFLWEVLAQRRAAESTVLATNTDAGLLEILSGALAGPDCHMEIREDAPGFWEALEDHGADLVVLGSEGEDLTGPDLCRVIRSHPRWRRLPIVVVGDTEPATLREAMDAGADDYLSADISGPELKARLENHLYRGRLLQARTDLDLLTGTGTRVAAERSLDRLHQLAARQGQPFALVLVSVDQFDLIRQTEGNAVCDVVLRRLGARLLDRFRGEDVVGRWTDDGFAVGIYGAGRGRACERVTDVLQAFAAEEVVTTSGKPASYTFSAGVAASPVDGSSLASLERLGESALCRARVARNCVVTAGERPVGQPPSIFDVVLVEDDDSVADVIEHALHLRHYEFLRFSDGAEAARALGEGQVKGHTVLLDVGLPSLDGFGVLQILRTQGILANTRVIMLTARSSESEMLRALGLGATEYIAKPFSIPILLGRLDQTRARSVA
jgi:diguanylate cyclase (GGDEF)-like protein